MSSWTVEAKRILQQIRKNPNADPFLQPVDWKALGLKDYPDIIKKPMDIGTMGAKLAGGTSYANLADFSADFHLIISNCKTYNAEHSPVFQMALALEAEFSKLIKSAAKRWQDEAKRIITSLKKETASSIFLEPVDWKSLGLTDYLKIIKTPMDLGTVASKLSADEYRSIDAFLDDIYLIWSNCMTYNADGSEVFNLALSMKNETDKLKAELLLPPQPFAPALKPAAGPGRRKSGVVVPPELLAEDEPSSGAALNDEEEEKRREDLTRLGKRFASLQHDYLSSAIRFIVAKCPKAVKTVDERNSEFEVDLSAIGADANSCDSINQLIKVMLYLQQNPE